MGNPQLAVASEDMGCGEKDTPYGKGVAAHQSNQQIAISTTTPLASDTDRCTFIEVRVGDYLRRYMAYGSDCTRLPLCRHA